MFTQSEWDIIHSHSYGTVEKVVNIQNAMAGFGYKQGNRYFDKTLEIQLGSLEALRDQLIEQEFQFLKKLFPHSTATDSITLLKEINLKLQEFQAALPNFLNNQELIDELENIRWTKAIEDRINQHMTDIMGKLEKDVVDKIMKNFNPQSLLRGLIAGLDKGLQGNTSQIRNFSSIMKTDSSGLISFESASLNPNRMQGILQYVMMVKHSENKGYQIQLSPNIPATYRKRLVKGLDNILGGETVSINGTNNHYQQVLTKYIKRYIPEGGINASDIIKYFDFSSLTKDYAWGGYGNTKGALGEIYWKAALNYLMGSSSANKVLATGTLLTSNSKQLPIDLVLDGLGAQVKNYRIANMGGGNEVIFYPETTTSLKAFLGTINAGSEEKLDMFVTSWGYNKPNYDYTPADGKMNYMGVYNRFSNIADSFNNQLQFLAQTHLAELMRITQDQEFSHKTDNLIYGKIVGKTQKTNTFYFFADRIVPASALVTEIIDGLKSQTSAAVSIESFKADDLKPASVGSVWPTFQPPTVEKGFWDSQKVRYRIRLDLSTILQKVLS